MEGLSWLQSIGPSAAVVVVVIFFLKHLAVERKALTVERTALTIERETHEKHANDRVKTIAGCVDRNNEVLGKTLEVMRRINGHQRRINGHQAGD